MQFTVRAADLPSLLDRAPADLACLSLDCFDTLIWRNAHAPQDVFADLPLQDRPALEAAIKAFFEAHGGMGPLLPTADVDQFRPYRRQQ